MLNVCDVEKHLKELGVSYQLYGATGIEVDTYEPLNSLESNKITWVKNWDTEAELHVSQLQNVIVICKNIPEVSNEQNCYVVCEDPKMCFFEVLAKFFFEKDTEEGIAETAVVKTDKIGYGSYVGDFSYIGKNVQIGKNVVIREHVTITGNVKIGDDVIIGQGAVLGKSGFGYYEGIDGHRKKVPHLGGIVVGNHVEIGANTCVDCGTMGDTVIGDYSKIDNLCHIGHNVQIAEDALIVAGTVIGGSCVIERGSYIAPGAVIKNQIRLGKESFVGMQTVVMRDVGDQESVFGVPGRAFKRDYKI